MNEKSDHEGIAEAVSTKEPNSDSCPVAKTGRRRFNLEVVLREQKKKKGLSAIYGKWPGEETDEEIRTALAELDK